ncbi:MAG: hypothetical protein HY401_09895 [Elusimicrobia bacterium]|nr:hypothetical protein [Elusimicrobiota bacterium]
MKIRLIEIPLKLFIGDLPWEKKHLQSVAVTVEIEPKGKPPDYWAISKGIIAQFEKKHYDWLEDLAGVMKKYLKREFKIRGKLILKKYPKVPRSPKIFEVTASL